MSHIVFISYSGKDKAVADAICGLLESHRVSCWMAPRNISPGDNFLEGIMDAINTAQIMVLVFSGSSNVSPHVIREVTEAVNKRIIIIPFRIENIPPSKSMQYLIGIPQWLEAYAPPREKHYDELAEIIDQIIKKHCIGALADYGEKTSNWGDTQFEDIQGTLERTQKPSAIYIQYLPEETPDVSGFMDRVETLEKLRHSLNQNTILIEGIAGIGKTYLAAKLKQILDAKYTTYWKELHSFDNFNTVTRNLAGFLKEHDDPALAEYIGNGGTEKEVIVKTLLSSLENKRYVLFFDNYHVVLEEEIHMLFSRLKDELKGSTIVITSRTSPPFVSHGDRIKGKISDNHVDGFDLETTAEYFKSRGVTVSSQQLIELQKQIKGHPLLLLMIEGLVRDHELDDLLSELPETGKDQYLYDEIFKRLNQREKEVLKAASVIRMPFSIKLCVEVASGEDVKETLRSLEEKFLVGKKGNYYYLHDLIRDFSYRQIDNPAAYHLRARDAYFRLEKNQENIVETVYHSVKAIGFLDDTIFEYLIDTPTDDFTDFIILDIIQNNAVKSVRFFDLMEKILSHQNPENNEVVVESLVEFRHLDSRKSVETIGRIINNKNKAALHLDRAREFCITNLANWFETDFENVVSIIEYLIETGETRELEMLCWGIKNAKIRDQKTADLLKRLIASPSERVNPLCKKLANDILEEWGFVKPDEGDDYIRILRTMDSTQALSYVEDLIFGENQFNRFTINHFILVWIIGDLLRVREKETTVLLRRMIEQYKNSVHFPVTATNVLFTRQGIRSHPIKDYAAQGDFFTHITSIFTILEVYSYLTFFKTKYTIQDTRFDQYYEMIKKQAVDLLSLFSLNDDPLIREMAKILSNEIIHPSKPDKQTIKEKIFSGLATGTLKMVTPDMMVKYLHGTKPGLSDKNNYMVGFMAVFAMNMPSPKNIYPILKIQNLDTEMWRLLFSYYIHTIRDSPTDLIELGNKISLQSPNYRRRYIAVHWASNLLIVTPEKTMEIYERLRNSPLYEDAMMKILLISSLDSMNIWIEIMDQFKIPSVAPLISIKPRVDDMIRSYQNDNDKEVRMMTDLVMNGIQFTDE